MPAAQRAEILAWFDQGVTDGRRYMIVWVDEFDFDDYPAYFDTESDTRHALATPRTMQRAMECYDLTADRDTQLNLPRAWAVTP